MYYKYGKTCSYIDLLGLCWGFDYNLKSNRVFMMIF